MSQYLQGDAPLAPHEPTAEQLADVFQREVRVGAEWFDARAMRDIGRGDAEGAYCAARLAAEWALRLL